MDNWSLFSGQRFMANQEIGKKICELGNIQWNMKLFNWLNERWHDFKCFEYFGLNIFRKRNQICILLKLYSLCNAGNSEPSKYYIWNISNFVQTDKYWNHCSRYSFSLNFFHCMIPWNNFTGWLLNILVDILSTLHKLTNGANGFQWLTFRF